MWSSQEVGVISESAKCCRPCFIINDNFTAYIVTSWANSRRWFFN